MENAVESKAKAEKKKYSRTGAETVNKPRGGVRRFGGGLVKKMLGSTAKLETKGAEIYKGRRKTHVRNELWLGIEKNDNLKG